MYEVFPELKESEDERIRKALCDIVQYMPYMVTELRAHGLTVEKTLAYLEKKKEQKSAEWSEEDEDSIEQAIIALEDLVEHEGDCYAGHHVPFVEAAKRLKSLRPQPHWKPSNLELGALRTAISVLTEERNFQKAGKHLQDILDHFEGKETRHDWKPSEEQMEALHYVKQFDYGGHKAALVSLYEDLKKLM